MDALQIGIVCGRCDSYSALGTTTCSSCASDLALEGPEAVAASQSALRAAVDSVVASSGAAASSGVASSGVASSGGAVVSIGTAEVSIDSNELAAEAQAAIAAARAAAEAKEAAAFARGEEVPTTNGGGNGNGAGISESATTRDITHLADEIAQRREAAAAAAAAGAPKQPITQDLPIGSGPEPLAPEAENGSSNGSASSPPISSRGGRLSGHIAAVKSSKPKSVEELMDQAKNFVCRSCSTPVPVGHKFCGRCGAAVPPEIMNARTQFFGQLQAPGKAKLILIRGEGVEGLSYQLNAEQHVVGKAGQLVFPDDPFVSPRHANFFYRNGNLCVRDEGSLNGVYLRVRGTIEMQPEDYFLAGEQVFRVDGPPTLLDTPGPDGTYFYSSPKHNSPFRITQILQGGMHGMTVCARTPSLQIGREGCDLNFPTDLYMSASHCKIEETANGLTLTDMSSRNGTYIRLKDERELGHGDYLFIGRKLLRVEITAA